MTDGRGGGIRACEECGGWETGGEVEGWGTLGLGGGEVWRALEGARGCSTLEDVVAGLDKDV